MEFKELGFLGLLIATGVIIFAILSGYRIREVSLPGGSGVKLFDPPTPLPPTPLPPTPLPLPLSGIWRGTLHQQLPNGAFASYSYELNLIQNENNIDGTATLQVPPPYGYYITMQIQGTLSGDVLIFNDGQIILNVAPPGWFWCRKSVKLTPTESKLQGLWSAAGCGSGQINLSR